ncbi:MAG: protein kinase domain-containing protein [Nocardioides sp.]
MSAPLIPGYTFVEHLGSGGFADVYCYEQEWPQQRVAVKVVRPDVALNERERALFTSEANAMARLGDHPNIVPVLTAGVTTDNRPFLVMRYCPPPDLGVRVRSSPLPLADAISTGIKLASAIETAHRAGTVHRDIKPSNVLVTSYHEPALTDFGIAGRLQGVAGDDEVRISYPWSPPEMLDGRSNGSIVSDVYSLGATVWHLLVGRSPYSIPGGDNSTRALSARILHAAPPATQRADVPPSLDRLLQQTMAKQPSHRPPSALDLARELQRIEAVAGFPRTVIAVEGDREPTSAPRGTPGEPDPDLTQVKPVSVVSASGPRAVRAALETAAVEGEPTGSRAAPVRASALAWTAVAVAVMAVVVTVLLVTGGGDRPDRQLSPTPTGPSTPQSVAPEAPTGVPSLSGRRTPRGATFTWASNDAAEPGDSWEWQRPETGESARTSDTTLLVRSRSDAEVCLQVRLIRGSFASEWAQSCVGPVGGP